MIDLKAKIKFDLVPTPHTFISAHQAKVLDRQHSGALKRLTSSIEAAGIRRSSS
jgi:hypothetical protein